MTKPKSILFITGNRLGDAVLSSGILTRLIQDNPGARVTVACGALPAGLFQDVPGLERIHPIVKKRRNLHWLELWWNAVGRRWDVVADLRGAIFAWLVPARKRLVAHAEKRREHRVAELARLLRLDPVPAPHLYVSAERAARAAEKMKGTGPVLAVGPTANWGGKQWPAERFAETVRRLTAPDGILPGARIAVCAAESERGAAQPVLDAIARERLIDLVGQTDLLDVFAMLRCCAFYLGNDSGLMHLAACAGIPTLGLFGPSPEWRYGPWGANGAVVRTKESYDEHMASPNYDYRSQRTMMESLDVETVVAAARDLWSRRA